MAAMFYQTAVKRGRQAACDLQSSTEPTRRDHEVVPHVHAAAITISNAANWQHRTSTQLVGAPSAAIKKSSEWSRPFLVCWVCLLHPRTSRSHFQFNTASDLKSPAPFLCSPQFLFSTKKPIFWVSNWVKSIRQASGTEIMDVDDARFRNITGLELVCACTSSWSGQTNGKLMISGLYHSNTVDCSQLQRRTSIREN
jgi:hypothetical protein